MKDFSLCEWLTESSIRQVRGASLKCIVFLSRMCDLRLKPSFIFPTLQEEQHLQILQPDKLTTMWEKSFYS